MAFAPTREPQGSRRGARRGGALLVGLCLLSAGCEESRTAAAAAPPLAASSRLAADLVYSRTLGEGRRALCVVPAGGGPERRLTDATASDGLPRWTPDGRAIVFSSDRSGSWQLWEVAAQGGRPRRVRSNDCNEWQADVSPDGSTLAFLSDCGGPQSLWLASTGGGAARLLVRHRARTVLGNPDWSPDGRRIVFSSNHRVGHQIFVVDVARGAERRVSALLSGGCEPRFSPDGRSVVHVTRGHHRPTSRLVEVDLASGAARTLVDWPALTYDPVYSPDGTELAFASDRTGSYQVYRLRLSDRTTDRVTSGPGEAREPDYRPSQ
jgi:Tol biopolymer transport system component